MTLILCYIHSGLPALSEIHQDAVSSADEVADEDEHSKQLVINKRRKQDCPKKVLDDGSSDTSRAGFKKILHCNQCDERFSEPSGLALHKLSAHKKRQNVEILENDDNSRPTSPEPAVKRRKPTPSATSSSGDKFKCGECGLRFPKFALLLKHLEDVPNCSTHGNNWNQHITCFIGRNQKRVPFLLTKYKRRGNGFQLGYYFVDLLNPQRRTNNGIPVHRNLHSTSQVYIDFTILRFSCR